MFFIILMICLLPWHIEGNKLQQKSKETTTTVSASYWLIIHYQWISNFWELQAHLCSTLDTNTETDWKLIKQDQSD